MESSSKLEVFWTRRNERRIYYKGHVYRQSAALPCHRLVWKCLWRKCIGISCPATVITDSDVTRVTSENFSHSHPSDFADDTVSRLRLEKKKREGQGGCKQHQAISDDELDSEVDSEKSQSSPHSLASPTTTNNSATNDNGFDTSPNTCPHSSPESSFDSDVPNQTTSSTGSTLRDIDISNNNNGRLDTFPDSAVRHTTTVSVTNPDSGTRHDKEKHKTDNDCSGLAGIINNGNKRYQQDAHNRGKIIKECTNKNDGEHLQNWTRMNEDFTNSTCIGAEDEENRTKKGFARLAGTNSGNKRYKRDRYNQDKIIKDYTNINGGGNLQTWIEVVPYFISQKSDNSNDNIDGNKYSWKQKPINNNQTNMNDNGDLHNWTRMTDDFTNSTCGNDSDNHNNYDSCKEKITTNQTNINYGGRLQDWTVMDNIFTRSTCGNNIDNNYNSSERKIITIDHTNMNDDGDLENWTRIYRNFTSSTCDNSNYYSYDTCKQKIISNQTNINDGGGLQDWILTDNNFANSSSGNNSDSNNNYNSFKQTEITTSQTSTNDGGHLQSWTVIGDSFSAFAGSSSINDGNYSDEITEEQISMTDGSLLPGWTNSIDCGLVKHLISGEEEGEPPQHTISNNNYNSRHLPTCHCCHNQAQMDDVIQCEGMCRHWFHVSCAGLTYDAYSMLRTEKTASWLCDDCYSYVTMKNTSLAASNTLAASFQQTIEELVGTRFGCEV